MEKINYKIDWSKPSKSSDSSKSSSESESTANPTSDMQELNEESEVSIQQQLEVSDQLLVIYYQAANKILNEEKFETAADAFTFLTFLNPDYEEFWIGFGVAEQSLGKYQEALAAYNNAEEINPANPTTFANSYQCHLALGNKEMAEHYYSKGIELCGEDPQYQDIKNGIEQFERAYVK